MKFDGRHETHLRANHFARLTPAFANSVFFNNNSSLEQSAIIHQPFVATMNKQIESLMLILLFFMCLSCLFQQMEVKASRVKRFIDYLNHDEPSNSSNSEELKIHGGRRIIGGKVAIKYIFLTMIQDTVII